MVYLFEQRNGGYQLVSKRRWLWNKRYDVYLSRNSVDKLILTAKHKKESANNESMTFVDAGDLVSILKKIGIEKRDLMRTRFPPHTDSKTKNDWEWMVNWLSTYYH